MGCGQESTTPLSKEVLYCGKLCFPSTQMALLCCWQKCGFLPKLLVCLMDCGAECGSTIETGEIAILKKPNPASHSIFCFMGMKYISRAVYYIILLLLHSAIPDHFCCCCYLFQLLKRAHTSPVHTVENQFFNEYLSAIVSRVTPNNRNNVQITQLAGIT